MCQGKANMNEGARRATAARSLLILLLCGSLSAATIGAKPSPAQTDGVSIPESAAAFELEEISAFDVPEVVRTRFLLGAYAECETEPDENVKAYPAFKSDKPLYGSLQVGRVRGEPQTGCLYAVAVDESAGTGRGYDRMYIDTNRNGDLTDDACRPPMKDVPEKALMGSSSLNAEVCFEPVVLQATPGDAPGRRIEVMPRFVAYSGNRNYVMLMGMKARKGTIAIGGEKLTAVLGHAGAIAGGFDQPDTGLYLLRADESGGSPGSSWYGGDRLMALHRRDNTYYRLAATPSGDKLFVWPYQGAFGTLEIKSGPRGARTVEASGSLASKDIALSLTEGLGQESAKPTDSYRLPVGDYGVQMLNVSYDRLRCLVLQNSHADGRPGGRRQEGPAAYAITIREDKPLVLDFSGKPQVLFASPGKDQRVQRGEPLEVKAVLIDPALDIMFRMVNNKEGQLKPTVVIKRANGKSVAEGTMPFG